jgi:small GTP-binding protein
MTSNNDTPAPAYIYKVCITGDAAVGKTSTVIRWSRGWFRADYQLTVGVQHYSRTVEVGNPEDPTLIKLLVWDLGGQDSFKTIRANYYSGAMGIVFMFDLSRKETFDALPKWIKEAEENVGKKVPFIIAGNKADLESKVAKKTIKEFAKSMNAEYIPTSAKTGARVSDLFNVIGTLVHEENMAAQRDANSNNSF